MITGNPAAGDAQGSYSLPGLLDLSGTIVASACEAVFLEFWCLRLGS